MSTTSGEKASNGIGMRSMPRMAPWAAPFGRPRTTSSACPDTITHKQETIFNSVDGMSGWGCIWDGVGKLKPEAWLVKKAYSPVRIDQRTFAIPEDGGTAESVLPIGSTTRRFRS